MVKEPRDKTQIRRDVILMLTEYGKINQTRLMSYCRLNMNKHKEIITDMERKGLIISSRESWGSRTIVMYSATAKGMEFYRQVLEPYEMMFPRDDKHE